MTQAGRRRPVEDCEEELDRLKVSLQALLDKQSPVGPCENRPPKDCDVDVHPPFGHDFLLSPQLEIVFNKPLGPGKRRTRPRHNLPGVTEDSEWDEWVKDEAAKLEVSVKDFTNCKGGGLSNSDDIAKKRATLYQYFSRYRRAREKAHMILSLKGSPGDDSQVVPVWNTKINELADADDSSMLFGVFQLAGRWIRFRAIDESSFDRMIITTTHEYMKDSLLWAVSQSLLAEVNGSFEGIAYKKWNREIMNQGVVSRLMGEVDWCWGLPGSIDSKPQTFEIPGWSAKFPIPFGVRKWKIVEFLNIWAIRTTVTCKTAIQHLEDNKPDDPVDMVKAAKQTAVIAALGQRANLMLEVVMALCVSLLPENRAILNEYLDRDDMTMPLDSNIEDVLDAVKKAQNIVKSQVTTREAYDPKKGESLPTPSDYVQLPKESWDNHNARKLPRFPPSQTAPEIPPRPSPLPKPPPVKSHVQSPAPAIPPAAKPTAVPISLPLSPSEHEDEENSDKDPVEAHNADTITHYPPYIERGEELLGPLLRQHDKWSPFIHKFPGIVPTWAVEIVCLTKLPPYIRKETYDVRAVPLFAGALHTNPSFLTWRRADTLPLNRYCPWAYLRIRDWACDLFGEMLPKFKVSDDWIEQSKFFPQERPAASHVVARIKLEQGEALCLGPGANAQYMFAIDSHSTNHSSQVCAFFGLDGENQWRYLVDFKLEHKNTNTDERGDRIGFFNFPNTGNGPVVLFAFGEPVVFHVFEKRFVDRGESGSSWSDFTTNDNEREERGTETQEETTEKSWFTSDFIRRVKSDKDPFIEDSDPFPPLRESEELESSDSPSSPPPTPEKTPPLKKKRNTGLAALAADEESDDEKKKEGKKKKK